MIVYRSIFKQLWINWFITMAIILIIFMTNQFVNELRHVVDGKITMLVLAKLASLQLVIFFNFLIPLAAYISLLLVLGRMYVDNEITVLQACGVSLGRLFGVVMSFGVVIMLLSASMSFWAGPVLEGAQATVMREAAMALTTQKIIANRFTYFTSDHNSVAYAGSSDRSRAELGNVFIAQSQHNNKMHDPFSRWDLIVSRKLTQKNVGVHHLPYMVASQGYRYHFGGDKNKLMTSQFSQYGVLLPQVNYIPQVQVYAAPMSTLISAPVTNLKAKGELQLRLAVPISVLVLMMVGFSLSKVDPRRGRFSYLLPAIIIYAVYSNAIFMGQGWISKGLISPGLGLWWLHALVLVLALIIMWFRHGSPHFLTRVRVT